MSEPPPNLEPPDAKENRAPQVPIDAEGDVASDVVSDAADKLAGELPPDATSAEEPGVEVEWAQASDAIEADGPDPADGLGDLAAAVRATSDHDYPREPAPFAPRLGSAALDAVVVLFLSLVVMGASIAGGVILPDWVAGAGVLLGLFGLPLLYSLTEVFWLATPGKSFVGLRIAGRDRLPPPVRRRLGRWAFKHSCFFVSVLCTMILNIIEATSYGPPSIGQLVAQFFPLVVGLVVLVSCLMVLLPDRLALHDLLSGTAVFREEDLRRPPPLAYAGRGFRPVMPIDEAEAFNRSAGER